MGKTPTFLTRGLSQVEAWNERLPPTLFEGLADGGMALKTPTVLTQDTEAAAMNRCDCQEGRPPDPTTQGAARLTKNL